MKRFITAFLLFHLLASSAQNWHYAGDTMASNAGVQNPYLAINKYNDVYMTYFRAAAGHLSASTRKLENNQWVDVGSDTTTGWATGISMDFDTSGIPYAAYWDQKNHGKCTVKRFNGANWEFVGSRGFGDGGTYTSIKIGPDNTPYLAFRDCNDFYYRACVMKFDGTNWVYVGPKDFSSQGNPTGASNIKLGIANTGKLYVAFADMPYNFRATVMTYNGSNWVFVGTPDISGGPVNDISLVIDSYGAPIIGYTAESGNQVTVKRFNGTSWVTIGQPAFTNAAFPFLTIDKNDNLYMAFTKDDKANVMKFDGNNWVQAGNAAFSPSVTMYTTMGVNDNGDLYCCFIDYTDRYTGSVHDPNNVVHCASVMKLDNTSAVGIKETNNSSFLFNVYPNPTNGKVQVNYTSLNENKGTLKIININGQLMFKEEFAGSYAKELNLSKYAKGIYFAEIKSGEATERKKIVLE